MANAFSRLFSALETWSFKYNCYEAVHPWTPHCSDCALDIGLTVFGEAIKLYTPLYLFSQFMQRRFDYSSFKNTSQSIFRSTIFISANAFFVLFFFCSSQYLTGKFYYYAVAFLPGFLASSMAVLIEKPGRRSSLAFYVANVASEALFRIHVARGYIRPVNNGQVYIFTFAMATIMMLAKKHGFEDDPLSAAIKLIVGSEEASLRPRRLRQGSLVAAAAEPPVLDSSQQVATSTNKEVSKESIGDIRAQPNSGQIVGHSKKVQQLGKISRALIWVQKLVASRHRLCPHKNCSCLFYLLSASSKAFLIGYGAQLSFRLLTRAPRLLNQPELLLRSTIGDKSLVRFGLFLSTFSALYKATNCALRWSLDSSTANNCFMAGLVAGPALFIYPSPTIALYVLWKCLEALFHEAVRMKLIKNKNLFIVILYGIATNQLFYSAVLDPRYMKKSYMSFLDRMSQHRLHMVNRSVLDVFGTEASTGYEEFFPDLHPKYMSPAFLGSIWIWMLEQKMLAKRLPASSAAIL